MTKLTEMSLSALAACRSEEDAWFALAACRGLRTEEWYPDSESEEPSPTVLSVCESCDVQQECLQWALDHNEKHGIWGGMSQRGRKNYVRRSRKRSRRQD